MVYDRGPGQVDDRFEPPVVVIDVPWVPSLCDGREERDTPGEPAAEYTDECPDEPG